MVKAVLEECLRKDGPVAIRRREFLVPAGGRDAIFVPSTFAGEEKSKESTFVIDPLEGGGNTCIVDTVESQINRIEPCFMREPYSKLLKQVEIIVKVNEKEKKKNLLEVGHRAGDALVRSSDKAELFKRAFEEYERGNTLEMAKLSPTSLLFGAWDSRETGVKIPRLFRAEIRAFNVDKVSSASTYVPPVNYVEIGLVERPSTKKEEEILSEIGMRHAPSRKEYAGVRLRPNGFIRRDVILNLVGIRGLGEEKVQRYILGLGLVAFTLPIDYDLRQGCLLVGDPDHPPVSELVRRDGSSTPFEMSPEKAFEFALQAARECVGKELEEKLVCTVTPESVRKKLSEWKKKKQEE